MSRTGMVTLCTIVLLASGVAGAADGAFGSVQASPLGADREFPPPSLTGAPIPMGTWDLLNNLQPSLSVPWGDWLAASFEGVPGLWVLADGSWQNLTTVTPQHLLVACRSLVASFQGFGIFLHNGDGWIPLHASSPAGLDAWGNENLLVNFGPGVGFWNYECPASVTCAFLDGAAWAVVDVGTDQFGGPEVGEGGPPPAYVSQSVIFTEVIGDTVQLSFFEDGFCDEEIEIFDLGNDCSFYGQFSEQNVLGFPWDCTEFIDESVVGRFTETTVQAVINEETVHSGPNCPSDYVYNGVATGGRCDPEVCWPCGEKF